MTDQKLKEALSKVDEVQCLELLDIKTHELLEAFPEKITTRRSYLKKELELDNLAEAVHELNFDD